MGHFSNIFSFLLKVHASLFCFYIWKCTLLLLTILAVFLSFQALNNVQSTHAGFGYVNSTNVFKASVLLFSTVSLC